MEPYKNHADYISDIQRLTDLKIKATSTTDTLEQPEAIWGLRKEIKERAALTGEVFLPVERVINAFCLNELEEHLLVTIFLIETNVVYRRRLFEALEQKSPGSMSLEVLADLAYCEIGSFSYSNFADNLLDYEQGSFFLKKEITRFIINSGEISKRPWKELYYPTTNDGSVLFESGRQNTLSMLVNSYFGYNGSQWRVIAVIGQEGSGRRGYVKLAANDNNISVIIISCKALIYENGFERVAEEIAVESILTGSLLCFAGFEYIYGDGEKLSQILWKIRRTAGLIFITTERDSIDLRDYGYCLTVAHVPDLNNKSAEALWGAVTKDYSLDSTVDFQYVANIFKLTPGQIKQAAMNAWDIAITEGTERIGQPTLLKACGNISTKNISALGRIIEPVYGWDDLVLPSEQKEMLRNAVLRVRLHKKVFSEWGFEKNTPYGTGVYILLHGPPGTGKTMAAQVLSRELGLPVYKIDLSAVVSKYIGETEKSLSKVFEESLRTNSILFFDEADALFGKRTEIKDSHDRHANLQVSFLLQKIEAHKGIVLLATNLDKNFDDAFRRRLHFIISFPMPEREQRLTIWKKAFPPEAPVESGVDFEYLAEEFKLSGSNIKNITLSAAFRAAHRNKSVGMSEIFGAVKEEITKNGGILATKVIADMDEYENSSGGV